MIGRNLKLGFALRLDLDSTNPMKHIGGIGAWLVLVGVRAFAEVDDTLDRLGEALTYQLPGQYWLFKASGILDLEGYRLSQPSPDILFTESKNLFSPRLTVFVDAQLGPRIYAFTQTRIDRGFDPTDDRLHARLDEYALRVALGDNSKIVVQVGKFGTVAGSWVKRHASWENPFITAPLAYGRLTGLWDLDAAQSTDNLLRWSHVKDSSSPVGTDADKYFRLPIIWGPAYGSGAALFAEVGPYDLAVEVKNTALSSRPGTWALSETGWEHPTFTGRIGYHPNPMWNLGFSASSGTYLTPQATPSLYPGYGISDYREVVLSHDISFAWHHWQVWAEIIAARFTIPQVAKPRVLSWYLETKYKFAPQFSGSIRFGQQLYSRIADGTGRQLRWGRNAWSLDIAPIYRLTAHLQLKLQYSLQHEDDTSKAWGHVIAAQTTLRF
jgi:hypothetical protein